MRGRHGFGINLKAGPAAGACWRVAAASSPGGGCINGGGGGAGSGAAADCGYVGSMGIKWASEHVGSRAASVCVGLVGRRVYG